MVLLRTKEYGMSQQTKELNDGGLKERCTGAVRSYDTTRHKREQYIAVQHTPPPGPAYLHIARFDAYR